MATDQDTKKVMHDFETKDIEELEKAYGKKVCEQLKGLKGKALEDRISKFGIKPGIWYWR